MNRRQMRLQNSSNSLFATYYSWPLWETPWKTIYKPDWTIFYPELLFFLMGISQCDAIVSVSLEKSFLLLMLSETCLHCINLENILHFLSFLYHFEDPHETVNVSFMIVTNYYYCSISVLNELHLASSGSKCHLISGGDSSCSWVFIRALGLCERKGLLTVMWSGSWWCVGSWEAPVPLQLGCWIWEEYKHSAWIQSLLITPKTGWWNTLWGGKVNTPTNFSNI